MEEVQQSVTLGCLCYANTMAKLLKKLKKLIYKLNYKCNINVSFRFVVFSTNT